MRKGENSPRIEKLIETPINERNGTKIKIYMVNPSDIKLFVQECKKQLAYFDNVYINISDDLKSIYGINIKNDYNIIEGNNFKVRDGQSPYNGLHLCLGKVAYPIDWDNLGVPGFPYTYLPVALKFEIGDLPVTFTREDIKYTENAIKKVKEKIKLVIEELCEIYNKQEFVKKSYDYFDLLKLHAGDTINGFKSGHIYLDNNLVVIDITTTINHLMNSESIKHDWVCVNDFRTNEFKVYLQKSDINIHIKKISCVDYLGLPFDLNYSSKKECLRGHISFEKKIDTGTGRISKCANSYYYVNTALSDYLNDQYSLVLNIDTDPDIKNNRYIVNEIFPKIIENIKKIDPVKFNFYIKDHIILVKINKLKLKDYKKILCLTNKNKIYWRKLIQAYQNTIEKPLLSQIKNYSYYNASEEWYKKWKKDNLKKRDPLKVADDEYNMFYTDKLLNIHSTGEENLKQTINNTFYFQIIKKSTIQSLDNLVIGLHDQKLIVGMASFMHHTTKKGSNLKVGFATVSKTVYEKLKKMNNVKLIEDYIKNNSQLFADYYYLNKVYSEITKNGQYIITEGFVTSYGLTLTYLEIFNPGISEFIIELDKTLHNIKDFKNLNFNNLSPLSESIFKFGIDLINKYFESNDQKVNMIKIKADVKFNDFKEKLKKNKGLIDKIILLQELGFELTNSYNGMPHEKRFKLLHNLNLVDTKSELLSSKSDIKKEDIVKVVKERISKLNFYKNQYFEDKYSVNFYLNNIVENYLSYQKNEENKIKLLEKI